MKNIAVARRYARALFDVARQDNVVGDVQNSLANIQQATQTHPQIKKIMRSPLVKPAEKEALVKSVTSNKLVLKLVGLMAKRKRLELFDLMAAEFHVLSDRDQGIRRLLVKTPAPLSEQEKRDIERLMSESTGGKAIGRFDVAQDLIGGVWIRMGDKVLDASLKGRIENLRTMLAHSVN